MKSEQKEQSAGVVRLHLWKATVCGAQSEHYVGKGVVSSSRQPVENLRQAVPKLADKLAKTYSALKSFWERVLDLNTCSTGDIFLYK